MGYFPDDSPEKRLQEILRKETLHSPLADVYTPAVAELVAAFNSDDRPRIPQHLLDRTSTHRAKLKQEREALEVAIPDTGTESPASASETSLAGLDGILSHSIQEAAGGLCSVRSLTAIGSAHRAEKAPPILAELQGYAEGAATPVEVQPFKTMRRMGKRGQIVTITSEEPNITRLGYLHNPTNKVLELWKLVEANPDSEDCSYAIFIPYLDDSLQIDFSMVVSKDDEAKPHSVEGLLYYGKGLTNAAVLEMLIQRLENDDKGDQTSDLASSIKLDELIARSGVALGKNGNVESSDYGAQTPLASWIGKLTAWASVQQQPILCTKSYKRIAEVTAIINPDATTSLTTKHITLGTSGRTVEQGTLRLDGNNLQADAEVSTAGGLVELASYVLDVPEVIVDENLQEKIMDIASKLSGVDLFNQTVLQELDDYRVKNKIPEDAIIDLGYLDVSHFEYDWIENALFTGFNSLRAHVIGNPNLRIFNQCQNLYDCRVDNAASAFTNCMNVRRSLAINTSVSFARSVAIQCLAIGGKQAYIGDVDYDSSAIECIAINVGRAFDNLDSATNSAAKDCTNAFYNVVSATNCIAEHCRFSFAGYGARKACEARNHRLFGLPFGILGRIDNFGRKNRITGRILGKDLAKLRGQYRQKA